MATSEITLQGETQWLPEQPDAAARVQRWPSIAAGKARYGRGGRMITQWNFPGVLAESKQIAHGISLEDHASVRAWPRRVEALLRFKPIPPSPLPPGI